MLFLANLLRTGMAVIGLIVSLVTVIFINTFENSGSPNLPIPFGDEVVNPIRG